MKILLSSPEAHRIYFVKQSLDAAGIPCSIQNENSHANFPGASFYPELWILNDSDEGKARILMAEALKQPHDTRKVWTCPKCGETSEAQFPSCWSCGEERPDDKEKSHLWKDLPAEVNGGQSRNLRRKDWPGIFWSSALGYTLVCLAFLSLLHLVTGRFDLHHPHPRSRTVTFLFTSGLLSWMLLRRASDLRKQDIEDRGR